MTIPAGVGALDYEPCRYGRSKAVFRGPARDLGQPYVAVLGGSSTFGKYVADPYPALVERRLGRTVVNLGGMNAGPDFYLSDEGLLDLAGRSAAAVVQITGAEGLSNPFYTVHSRRNDRFLAATPLLRDLYPEVDLAEINFTRHLLLVLRRTDPARFGVVVDTLKANWLTRMRRLLSRLPASRLLLWIDESAALRVSDGLGAGPLFIDRALLAALRADVSGIVTVVPTPGAWDLSACDMTFPETEAAQAACLPGAAVHAEIAAVLGAALQEVMQWKGPPEGGPS